MPRKQDAERLGIRRTISLLVGDMIRDHISEQPAAALWPYNAQFQLLPEEQIPDLIRLLWPCKTVISKRRRSVRHAVERGEVSVAGTQP